MEGEDVDSAYSIPLHYAACCATPHCRNDLNPLSYPYCLTPSRDTHIRQLKVFGPRTEVLAMGDTPVESFKTVEMQQYAVLR